MFSGRTLGTSIAMQNISRTPNPSTEQSLDNLVAQVGNTTTNNTEIISNNTIEMLRRRISRLENNNNVKAKANKVYESLDKRLSALEKMYSENMENMEKYVRNQEDRINLLTVDYRKTLETLNTIIRDVNNKIVELDESVIKKPKALEEKLEEVELAEPLSPEIVEVRGTPVIKKEETNDKVIAEVTEEILNKVVESEDKPKQEGKNVTLMIVEKELSNEN